MEETTAAPRSWLARVDGRARAAALALLALGYLPLVFLGPGTDIDVAGVYQAGASILDGEYQVSRTPGAPVFEAATGLLHALGGSVVVNLASLGMAVVTAAALFRLLEREGHAGASWLALAVLVNPFVWVAGTSMVDFLWATGLALSAANLQLSRRYLPAMALYALAAGCRLSTLALVAALILGDALGRPRHEQLRLALLGVGVAALAGLIFLPPFMALGWGFLSSEVPGSSPLVQLGRFGAKNAFFFGPMVLLLVAVLARRLVASLWRVWPSSAVLRMGLLGMVAVELLFLRFPWKLAHLIPAWLFLLLVLGAARVLTARATALLLASQLVLGAVNLNLAQPDQPDQAAGGRLVVELVEGPLLRDVRCRLDGDRGAYRDPDALDEVLATWACVVPWSE